MSALALKIYININKTVSYTKFVKIRQNGRNNAKDKDDLDPDPKPPSSISNSDGRLSNPTPAVRSWSRERVFMPFLRSLRRSARPAAAPETVSICRPAPTRTRSRGRGRATALCSVRRSSPERAATTRMRRISRSRAAKREAWDHRLTIVRGSWALPYLGSDRGVFGLTERRGRAHALLIYARPDRLDPETRHAWLAYRRRSASLRNSGRRAL
jgi:hypothetical protein